MNYQKLFEAQRVLDEHIIGEKKLEGQDLFVNKVEALLCEIQETANEQRTWKFWSEDQKARTLRYDKPKVGEDYDVLYCHTCGDYMAVDHELSDCPKAHMIPLVERNPLLEETIDVLHFILSLGNDLQVNPDEVAKKTARLYEDLTSQFIALSYTVSCIAMYNNKEMYYFETIGMFKGLVALLGFTEEQLEEAYYKKNEENHERQATGY